jgi:hypothetical protein
MIRENIVLQWPNSSRRVSEVGSGDCIKNVSFWFYGKVFKKPPLSKRVPEKIGGGR